RPSRSFIGGDSSPRAARVRTAGGRLRPARPPGRRARGRRGAPAQLGLPAEAAGAGQGHWTGRAGGRPGICHRSCLSWHRGCSSAVRLRGPTMKRRTLLPLPSPRAAVLPGALLLGACAMTVEGEAPGAEPAAPAALLVDVGGDGRRGGADRKSV